VMMVYGGFLLVVDFSWRLYSLSHMPLAESRAVMTVFGFGGWVFFSVGSLGFFGFGVLGGIAAAMAAYLSLFSFHFSSMFNDLGQVLTTTSFLPSLRPSFPSGFLPSFLCRVGGSLKST